MFYCIVCLVVTEVKGEGDECLGALPDGFLLWFLAVLLGCELKVSSWVTDLLKLTTNSHAALYLFPLLPRLDTN